MLDVLNALVKAIENRERVALATVIAVKGASPAWVGFKLGEAWAMWVEVNSKEECVKPQDKSLKKARLQ